MKDLLLEIGLEEVPARFLPEAAEALRAETQRHLRAERLEFAELQVYATPRRLAVLARKVPERQWELTQEVFGPPVKAAFDPEGRPTKAAQGFAASVGVSPQELLIREKKGKQYVAAILRQEGKPAQEVLPSVLKGIILSLRFPKSMRWADKSLRFIRPIRWLLALWGEEVLELELEGLRSSNLTWGHRFLAPGPWQVRHPEEYLKVLAEHFVMAEPRRRRETIEQALRELAQGLGASPVWDQELLEHVVHLVEYPVGVLCEFPIQYLELPEELLVTVMKDHQKYFALRGSDGRLLSHFVVISNTLRENALVVKAGAERVIKARFEDARFYWRQDLEQSLQRRLEGLKKVVYHERLGSLYDKALRLKSLAGFMAPRAAVETALAERAALLSKADLVSGVVREFPELQGVMGGYYALNDGEPPEVAQAIREHYLPRHAGDALPCSPLAVLLSLADKADNIASFFLLGLVPSGSEDPFALRRQALAIVHMLAEAELPLSLEELFEQALRGLQAQDNQALREAVLGFLRQRIPQVLQARGYESDVVEAVLPYALAEPLKSLLQRAEALRRLKKHAQFNPFLVAAKRVRNILPGEEPPPLREDLLREEGEQRLYQSLRQCAEKTEACLQDGDLEEAAEALLALTEPINHFFDAVLVMDKDPLVRANRLALLRDVWGLCLKVADFSKISEV